MQIEYVNRNYQPNPWTTTFLIIFPILLFLQLWTSNPSTEDHRKAVVDKVETYVAIKKDNWKTSNELEEKVKSATFKLANTFTENIAKNLISRIDFIFFSLTKSTFREKSYIIGIGVWGRVFIWSNINLNELK